MATKKPKFEIGQKVKVSSMALNLKGTIQNIDGAFAGVVTHDGKVFAVSIKWISAI